MSNNPFKTTPEDIASTIKDYREDLAALSVCAEAWSNAKQNLMRATHDELQTRMHLESALKKVEKKRSDLNMIADFPPHARSV